MGSIGEARTILVDSFVEDARFARQAPSALPQTRNFLTIKVTLIGEWQQNATGPPTVYTEDSNPVSQSQIEYHWWRQQWNVVRWYQFVSRFRYNIIPSSDGDEIPDWVEVTLRPGDDPCGDGQFQTTASCTQIRNAVNCALAGTPYDVDRYVHRAYIGPGAWGCGFGLGTLGPSSNLFVALSHQLAIGLTGVLRKDEITSSSSFFELTLSLSLFVFFLDEVMKQR